MNRLERILEEWKEDSKIGNDLAHSSIEFAKKHEKYLTLYTEAKIKLKASDLSQKSLLKVKWLYYNGKLSPEEITSKSWVQDPFDGLKVLKGDMNYYYDADPEIQKSEANLEFNKIVVETLKEILDTIKWRHQTIRNIISYKQFEAGN